MKKRVIVCLLLVLPINLWCMVYDTRILQQFEFNQFHSKIVHWAEKPLPKELSVVVKNIFLFFDKHTILEVTFGKLSQHEEKTIKNLIDETKAQLKKALQDLSLQEEVVDFMTQSFLNYSMTAEKHEQKKIIQALHCNGKLLAKMYDFMILQGNNPSFIPIKVEIALRNSFFGSEYKKEYFFTDALLQKVDNENHDNKRYWFYAKKIKKPEIGAMVIDKR